jgi:hypothetical protein
MWPFKRHCFLALVPMISFHFLLFCSQPLLLPFTLHLQKGPFKGQTIFTLFSLSVLVHHSHPVCL